MNLLRTAVAAALITCAGSVWAGPVNVNTADAKTIAKELAGVGDKIAEAIVTERAKAPFKDAADLANRVKGVGDAIIAKNKDNLKFSS